MLVILQKGLYWNGQTFEPGATMNLPDTAAINLIQEGRAIPARETRTEKQVIEPPEKTAPHKPLRRLKETGAALHEHGIEALRKRRRAKARSRKEVVPQ